MLRLEMLELNKAKSAIGRLSAAIRAGLTLRAATCAIAGLILTLGQPARAAVLDWTFTTQAVSDNFNPKLPSILSGSGTLTINDSPTAGAFDDGFGDSIAGQFYVVTGFTGTLKGSGFSASITGLLPNGASWGGFSNDTGLLVLTDGQGFALAPSGVLVALLSQSVDGAAAVGFSTDPFFGGFIDTANGSEWQGAFTLTAQAGTQPVPEPAIVAIFASGLLALAYGRRRLGIAAPAFRPLNS